MGIFDRIAAGFDKAFSPLSDDEVYHLVAKELADNNLDPGLWTRALADSDFDKERAKAAYVKYRVAAIHRAAGDESLRRSRALAAEKKRQKEWYKSVEENAYGHLDRGEYDLAAVGFVERVKKRRDVDAMHNLGWLAENGHVKKATVETAIGWYRQAVENGRQASALAISDAAFRQGQYREALKWAEYAVGKGVPGAREARIRAARAAGVKLRWWQW